jgi:hypothetical protein
MVYQLWWLSIRCFQFFSSITFPSNGFENQSTFPLKILRASSTYTLWLNKFEEIGSLSGYFSSLNFELNYFGIPFWDKYGYFWEHYFVYPRTNVQKKTKWHRFQNIYIRYCPAFIWWRYYAFVVKVIYHLCSNAFAFDGYLKHLL